MSYTIETIIKVDGGAYPFRTKCEGSPKDKDFSGFLAKHTASIENYLKPKHPLEEVFAKVPKSFISPEIMLRNELTHADMLFARCTGGVSENKKQEKRWTRVAIGWAATRLIKMGYYKTLPEVLQAAVEQATKGKGQRHGGDRTPFLEQHWVRLYKTHGLGFLLGQADKKYHEALGKENEADQCREILGAIVYLGMALLVLEGRVK